MASQGKGFLWNDHADQGNFVSGCGQSELSLYFIFQKLKSCKLVIN